MFDVKQVVEAMFCSQNTGYRCCHLLTPVVDRRPIGLGRLVERGSLEMEGILALTRLGTFNRCGDRILDRGFDCILDASFGSFGVGLTLATLLRSQFCLRELSRFARRPIAREFAKRPISISAICLSLSSKHHGTLE